MTRSSARALHASVVFTMLVVQAACTPSPPSPAPEPPGPFPAGAVRAICVPDPADEIYVLVGAAPGDAEAVEMVQRGLAEPRRAREDIAVITLRKDGSALREAFVLAPEVVAPGAGVAQSLLRGAAPAGTLSRARSGGPATGMTLDAKTYICRSEKGLRLVAVSRDGAIFVRRADPGQAGPDQGPGQGLQTGAPSAVVIRAPWGGGAESVCAGAVWEEGRSSVTVTQDCGSRRILYAPAAAPGSDAVWQDGVKTTQTTLTAVFIDWSPPPEGAAR